MNLSPPSILIIDDEQSLRRSLAFLLDRAGYKVDAVGTGAEGVQRLGCRRYDLVFLDLKLAGENGIDLVPTIRSINRKLPILILTAHASMETAIAAIRGGVNDYLTKPANPEKILSRVQEILNEQEKQKRESQLVNELEKLTIELGRANGFSRVHHQPRRSRLFVDDPDILVCGPISADLHTRYIKVSGRVVRVSPTSFQYLVVLMRHWPDIVPVKDLVNEAQGYQLSLIEARDLARCRIHELRQVLDCDKSQSVSYIETVRGEGYRLLV